MDILLLDTDQVSQLTDLPKSLPESGFLWLDVIHGEDDDWPQLVLQLTGISIHERHIAEGQQEGKQQNRN